MAEETIVKRTAPHAPEAERSCIGAMLIDREAIEVACEYLTGEDFYNRQLGVYFDAIAELHRAGREADPVTLQEKLKEKNLPPEYTRAEFIRDLVTDVVTSAHIRSYAQAVQDNAVRRRLIRVAEELATDCYAGGKEIDVLLDTAEKNIFDVTQQFNRGEYKPISRIVMEGLQRISEAGKIKGNITGLATGFSELDYATAGFQPSDLILIAARPSMGKTALALSITDYMAFHDKRSVAIFSLEMSKEQLLNRLFSMESRVGMQQLRTGNLSDAEWERLVAGADTIGASHLIIDDTPGLSVSEMRSKCRKYKAEHGLDIAFVDYLQLMSPGRGRSSESRQQEISEISRSLKALARELNIPVVALSQLSRAVESRTDHRPMLSDLRESGAIEQDADVVMFLYRDEYYNKDTEKRGITEVTLAKQRNGPLGMQELLFLPENARFVNIERKFREGTD
ncbi:MAG: replicative DNA helicase [Lachnospiraceae bacterium]|nr:replicative DNA helicase [Lachnospiraceae bacterium]